MSQTNGWLAGAFLVLAACGTATTEKTASIDGALETTSFPEAPSGLDVRDEAGTVTHVAIAADGAFTLTLPAGHEYAIEAVLSSRSVPVVFPQADGSIGTTAKITKGGFAASLGKVRYFDAVPEGGVVVRSSQTSAGDGDGECENGIDAATGAPCVDDDANVTCEEGDDGEVDDDDVECENGVDANTGAPCEDGPDDDVSDGDGETDDDAEPQGEVALPEHGIPENPECGDGDGEEADD